ncbi:hypothetical protein [Escherichia coli]|uniref:hypothetical protein n=1 Tax=Escherichia coli TaxID=562 RepID=UPI003FA17D35
MFSSPAYGQEFLWFINITERRPLIEQDPLVTIDIITHRYYGVGGQWVQDAGEYLHMMSDAGIRIKGE